MIRDSFTNVSLQDFYSCKIHCYSEVNVRDHGHGGRMRLEVEKGRTESEKTLWRNIASYQ